MAKKKRFVGLAETIFIFFSFICLSSLFVYLNLFIPVSSESKWKEIEIPYGASYAKGINILKEGGIIKNSFIFLVLGRITMTDRKLRAGYYSFNLAMRPWEIFTMLQKGRIVQFRITIPAGSTLEDIKLKFNGTGLIDNESWQLVRDRDFLDSLKIDSPSLEGYIYPDTYNFAKGTKPEDIFKIKVQRLREYFDQSLLKRAEELGMSEREVLTLASIIEKEALYDRERPIISAVYHNRLKINMRLQADPTVVYGIKRMQDGITRKDLKRATPYNTYVINGLPPGPIASSGIKSIRAALYPADVDFLYFVSKNNGTHHFSKTGKEHFNAVLQYQRRNRSPKNEDQVILNTKTETSDRDKNKNNESVTENKNIPSTLKKGQ